MEGGGFVGVNVNKSSLEGPACCLSMTGKKVGFPLDRCCCPLLATWVNWLEGICVSGIVKVYSLSAGAGCCGCKMSVAQMLKLHLSIVKVSVAGADNRVLLPCFECW